MKRFYSHYTFIYPDIYLKNYILELDSGNHIVDSFPFEKEVENTSFYSGLLIFIPVHQNFDNELVSDLRKEIVNRTIELKYKKEFLIPTSNIYSVYTEDGILL